MARQTTIDPHILCPACDALIFLEDSFDYGEGSEVECPKCDAMLTCVGEEPQPRAWTWETPEEDNPQGWEMSNRVINGLIQAGITDARQLYHDGVLRRLTHAKNVGVVAMKELLVELRRRGYPPPCRSALHESWHHLWDDAWGPGATTQQTPTEDPHE